jgi:hypothetical protein
LAHLLKLTADRAERLGYSKHSVVDRRNEDFSSVLDRALTKSAAQEILNSPTCLLWPDCACHQNIVHWQEALSDEERTFDHEQLHWAEELIFCTCACVAQHCPVPETKAYAAQQQSNLTQRRYRIAREQRQVALQELRAQRAREAGAN